MLSTVLLSALAVNAAPAKRQNSGYMITVPAGAEPNQNNPLLCLATNFNPNLEYLGDGTNLGFYPCTQVQFTNPTANMYGVWDIQYGNQLGIQLVGTNFCLDAGSNPDQEPSSISKVWTCYPGLPQQQFYYTGDNHIAVTGASLCLDQSAVFGPFFEQCGSNNYPGQTQGDTQAFNIMPVNGGSPPATMTTMTSTSTPAPSMTSSSSPTPSGNFMVTSVNWNPPGTTGANLMCLTLTNGQAYDGSPVGIAPCNGLDINDSPNAPLQPQVWAFAADNDAPGVTSIQLANTNYCVDFGTGGGYDGTAMKIWQCYPGLFQQTFYWTADQHIAVYGGTQCLDVERGTTNVQSYQCSGGDPQQLWNAGF